MKLEDLIKKLENTKNILQYELKENIKQVDNINYGIATFIDPKTKFNDLYAFIFNNIDSNEIYGFTRFSNNNLYQYLYDIEDREISAINILNFLIDKKKNLNYLFNKGI